MGKYLQHNGNNLKTKSVEGILKKTDFLNSPFFGNGEVKSEENTMITWEKLGKRQTLTKLISSFSYDLPMSTSTASVHVSPTTLDMQHRYDPPCSAAARSICR